MTLFFYYAWHSLVNQIKKLLKTWVLFFLLACIVGGIVIGIIAGAVLDDVPEEEISEEEETEEETALSEIETTDTIELIIFAVITVMTVYHIASADKSGNAVFLPADVALLFPSPMKPQRVLLFRLVMQMGTTLFFTLYLLCDVPMILGDLQPAPATVIAVFAMWFLTIVLCKSLQVFLYTIASTHPGLKKWFRNLPLGLLVLTAIAFYGYYRQSNLSVLKALVAFFNAKASRAVPVIGWLKGIYLYTSEENLPMAGLCVLGVFLLGGVLIYATAHTKADFYEEAMAKSEETATLLNEAVEGRTAIRRNSKKDRSEKIRRDGFRYGSGANVFFHKCIYNRGRFATLGIFTKTSILYLAIGVILPLLFDRDITAAVLGIAAIAFFRSLGNPIVQDTQTVYFMLLPESTWEKVFWSTLGGTACCFLDMIPGMIAATALCKVNPLVTLAWMLFIASLDLYSSHVFLFIDFSTPSEAGKNIKQLVPILFLYFGLVPDAAMLVIGMKTGMLAAFALFASLINLLIGGIFFLISPTFLEKGRK